MVQLFRRSPPEAGTQKRRLAMRRVIFVFLVLMVTVSVSDALAAGGYISIGGGAGGDAQAPSGRIEIGGRSINRLHNAMVGFGIPFTLNRDGVQRRGRLLPPKKLLRAPRLRQPHGGEPEFRDHLVSFHDISFTFRAGTRHRPASRKHMSNTANRRASWRGKRSAPPARKVCNPMPS